MNTNIKLLFATGILTLAVGCTDLDVPVSSQYTKYPANEIAIQSKMANIYFKMKDCFGRRYMEAQALSSDEETAVAYNGGWLDSYAYAHPSLHDYTYEEATLDWMGVLGTGVVTANEVIYSGADVKYVAPARAMRAFLSSS